MSNGGRLRIVDTIQGTGFLSIVQALSILDREDREDLELAQHDLRVLSVEQREVVVMLGRESGVVTWGARLDPAPRALSAGELERLALARPRDSLHGTSYPAVAKAVEAFPRDRADLALYTIQVLAEGEMLTVTFIDKDTPPGTRGSWGQPGFQVTLRASDLSVLHSSYLR